MALILDTASSIPSISAPGWALGISMVIGSFASAFAAIYGALQSRTTHTLVNSRMTEMLALNKAEALARGTAEGMASERARPADSVIKVDVVPPPIRKEIP